MALDISSLQSNPQVFMAGNRHLSAATPRAALAGREKASGESAEAHSADESTRLALSVNSKLGEVVIKVIDTGTDKVVREIPAKELQNVSERIREVMGLLFDRRA